MAKSERKRPFKPPGPAISVDAWTLKCLYKGSDYANRIASGEFVKLYEDLGKPKADGERSITVYYGRGDDRLTMVQLQWFEKDGVITRSGLKEPKWMYRDGIVYHRHGGDRSWERLRRDLTDFRYGSTDPTLVRLKKLYGDWRRYKCDRFGPVEAWWRVRWFTSRPYASYRFAIAWCGRGWVRARQVTKPLRSRVRRLFLEPKALVLALA